MEINGTIAARLPKGNDFFGLARRKSTAFARATVPRNLPNERLRLFLPTSPLKKTRIKSKTIGHFDHAIHAAKVLENIFGKVVGFGLRRHRNACGLIMTGKFATESDCPVVGCKTPKTLVSSLLQKNPIGNRCEYLRHDPGSQERERWTKNNPTAGVDVVVSVFVGFCNMQFLSL
jgi:hypothetical protein